MDTSFWPLECSHSYHRECLKGYFNSKINERSLPLKCPNVACKCDVGY